MARVVTSDAAVGLISRLQQDIDQVQQAMDAMLGTGKQLASPQVWEGSAANRFRDGEWARTETWARTAVLELGELRATVQRINDDIQLAGGGLG